MIVISRCWPSNLGTFLRSLKKDDNKKSSAVNGASQESRVRYQCGASWAVAVGRFPIFYLSKSHFDSWRARRFFEALIIVPAVYLALQQQPAARSIALLSLGRKRGWILASAIEGDRGIRARTGGAHRVIRVLYA